MVSGCPSRKQGRATWFWLQGHASMPADATTIDTVEIDLPMGRYQGLRYTRVTGDVVDTFWFALSLPGAPVRMESRVGGPGSVLSWTTIAAASPPESLTPRVPCEGIVRSGDRGLNPVRGRHSGRDVMPGRVEIIDLS